MLNIKKLQLSSSLIQGPLAGVSARPFRELVWQYSQPAYTCTEMISCKTILHDRDFVNQRFINKSPLEKILCVQLSANDALELGEAVKMVTDMGADMIDLNCGCPKKKIRMKHAGSKLLSDPTRLYQMVKAMKDNTDLPISIKIRVDSASDDRFNQDIVSTLKDTGVDLLVVHGRHWTEQYETPCNYDEIAFFVDELDIPVIGNGDVACKKSLKKMLDTGCHAAMIGRASVGQPWLIQQLDDENKGLKFNKPTFKQVAEIFLSHIEKLSTLLNSEKFALLHARKLAKYYARDLKERHSFCDAVNQCMDFAGLERICDDYFVEQ